MQSTVVKGFCHLCSSFLCLLSLTILPAHSIAILLVHPFSSLAYHVAQRMPITNTKSAAAIPIVV